MLLRLALTLAFLSLSPHAIALGESWKVSLHRYGPIVFGMSLKQLEKAVGSLTYTQGWVGNCTYVRAPKLPDGVYFMIQKNRVVRIDIDAEGVKTLSEAQVGNSKKRILKLYKGRIKTVKQRRFKGEQLIFTPKNKNLQEYSLIFDVDKYGVLAYRAGFKKYVDMADGCLTNH